MTSVRTGAAGHAATTDALPEQTGVGLPSAHVLSWQAVHAAHVGLVRNRQSTRAQPRFTNLSDWSTRRAALRGATVLSLKQVMQLRERPATAASRRTCAPMRGRHILRARCAGLAALDSLLALLPDAPVTA